MSIQIPASLADLKEYVLYRLGKPVVNIEIDNIQLEIAILEAFQEFYEYHFEGYKIDHVSVNIPISGIFNVTGNLSDVIRIIKVTGDYHYFERKLAWMAERGDQVYGNRTYDFTFSPITRELKIIHSLTNDTNMLLTVYRAIQAADNPSVYNEHWLKKYATALARIQWGYNVMKYDNIPLPGGMTISGSEILSQGKEDAEKLREELHDKYQERPLPQVW